MIRNRNKILIGLAILTLSVLCFIVVGSETAEPIKASVDSRCEECHEGAGDKYLASSHGRLGEHEFAGEGCQSCHGSADEHIASMGETAIPHPFNEATREDDVQAVCVSCHVGGKTMGWHDSAHSASGVVCIDCHAVKEPFGAKSKKADIATCEKCHANQVSLFNLPSHHPLREGLMTCTDCHNPHAETEMMLKGDTVNELCYSCHADKQGPFLWEHDPVVENCLYCHSAKGAMHNGLLQQNENVLCGRCHTMHSSDHTVDRWEDGFGGVERGMADMLGKCTRCHNAIHGTDHTGFNRGAFIR